MLCAASCVPKSHGFLQNLGAVSGGAVLGGAAHFVFAVSLSQASCGMPGSLAAVNLVCIKYCWLLSLDVSSSH